MVAGFVGLPAPALAYAPTPSAAASSTPVPGAGQRLCTIVDPRVTEISGLVATATGYVAINDSQTDRSRMKVFTFDNGCKVVGTPIAYSGAGANDPEDVGIDKNGTIWVADIGDNVTATTRRKTVALVSIAPGAKETVVHRLAYPDGQARDAEALLFNGDGTPIIVTKVPAGEVWVPETALVPNSTAGVKMKKAGTFKPQKTGTPNKLAFIGEGTVTGGAVSTDGTKAIIRTLSDAYEFDVTGGDVVKAITTGKPRITPLPNEPQGEAITFSIDGKSYVTASDLQAEEGQTVLLRYTPSSVNPSSAGGQAVPSPAADKRSFFSSLSLQDITYIVAGVGVLGLLMVVAGVVGIRRSRSRRAAAMGPVRGAASVADPRGEDDYDDGFGPDDGAARGGTVYGGHRPPAAAPGHGTVYGAGAPYERDDGRRGQQRYDDYAGGGYEPAGYAAGDYPPDYDGYESGYRRRR